MTVLILHISDIHIKTQKDPILRKGRDIGACVYSSLPTASHVFIIVSGDIAFSGESTQYDLATKFLEEIRESIKKETSIPIDFIITPGNHDCDFSQNVSAREILVKSLEESESPEIDSSVIQTCTIIQKQFFEFRRNLEKDSKAKDDLLWRSSRFNVEDKVLGFDCLNVSWTSNLREKPGRLYFPVNPYAEKNSNGVDVQFIVLHHPLNWFSQSIYRPFRSFIRNLADIVISGHEHQGNIGVINDTETDKSAFVEGCVLQGKKGLSDSSFNVLIIDLDQDQFASTTYKWNGTQYDAIIEGSWSDYLNFPSKSINPFIISNSFQEVLDDPGAFFRHPGCANITLSDIFIYPDLRKIGNRENKQRDYISASRLLSPELIADGILIQGEEKTGGTSLLYQLYRQYHDRGFVPLLIKGRDLRKIKDSDIDSLIKRVVKAQYGADHFSAFQQLPSSQKLLLLDDFDDCPIKAADAQAGLICAFRKRFGHIVITVSEMFEVREMLGVEASSELALLEHYMLQPFGYALRLKLIERWFSLGLDGTISEATIISQCDQAERLMNTVMTNLIIPSTPLYLLTLLQSMEAGRSGDFKESALGYYYQYLLTEAFQNCGVKQNKLTEVFQYAAHLSWEYHVQGKRELSKIELREFNTKFSREWHTVAFTTRFNLLVKARVLSGAGEDYAFRYPYIYYYLKGQYLSENLNNLDIREYIGHCCKHLYVREHANTVLFLAHHTNDAFVLDSIAESLHNLFQHCAPFTFSGDTGGINKLIQDAPKLTYSGETPTEHRHRINQLQDELDDGRDGLTESEENLDELSLISQMTMLFKATEILGQVLKNQYAKIQRRRKGDLLEELFNGPLRALRNFYDYFEKYPDALVDEIEAAVQRRGEMDNKEECTIIARRVVSGIVQIVTFSFVMRAAQAASSDSLLEDVRDVVKSNGSIAFKLIELSIDLDSPKAIPRRKLKQLYMEAENDLVTSRLIRIMVLNRLYMFKTTEQDMQWLSEKLKLDIGVQHAITYKEKKGRLIK